MYKETFIFSARRSTANLAGSSIHFNNVSTSDHFLKEALVGDEALTTVTTTTTSNNNHNNQNNNNEANNDTRSSTSHVKTSRTLQLTLPPTTTTSNLGVAVSVNGTAEAASAAIYMHNSEINMFRTNYRDQSVGHIGNENSDDEDSFKFG